jgi:adenylate cyclase
MAIEIERKFLLQDNTWQQQAITHVTMRQGYIKNSVEGVVRVRLVDTAAFLTIKGRTSNFTRLEYEYPIPIADAREMLDRLCPKPLVEKQRFFIDYRGFTWCVDRFTGANQGLVLAEIELESEDQPFEPPAWIGPEVTNDPRYCNACLVTHPYSEWKDRPDP